MRKLFVGIAVMLVFGIMTASAIAQVGKGLSGKHYNLNIIGAPKSKKVDYDVNPDEARTSGHTLFVPLVGHCKIIMTQDLNGKFEVIDRNGTDGQAEFNIAPGYYDVYAVALGKPGGAVEIIAFADFGGDIVDPADPTNKIVKIGEVDLTRESGKPQRKDINKLFYVDAELLVNGVPTTFNNVWIFDIVELLEYYWSYTNDKCKLVQVRFYKRPDEVPAAPARVRSTATAWGSIKDSH